MTAPIFGQGDELTRCECCGKQLLGRVRFLELDQRSQTFHDYHDVPPNKSQGWFPFGLGCAKKLVKAEVRRRADDAHASKLALAKARYDNDRSL